MTAIIILVILAVVMIVGAYLTDPFTRLSIVKQPFVLKMHSGKFRVINENHRLTLRQGTLWRWFAIAKCGIHIVGTRYVHSPPSMSDDVEGIIKDIYEHRYKPDKLLLTSGDHFSALFVRNLGVFFYPVLDPRISGTQQEWEDRQVVYVQTLAYALGVFAKRPIPVTTIVTTGQRAATCVNFYAYPSDTVYGILYALSAALGTETPIVIPKYAKSEHVLQTQDVADALLDEYRETMQKLYGHYRETAYDSETGLVRLDVHMSGAKDITRRSSAFYDNVIFWKTTQLAMRLGLLDDDQHFLDGLKKRILNTFWLSDKGYFLEDLSEEGKKEAYYSSDWLIVLTTGFLSLEDSTERDYFTQSIAYIQKHGIDKPFALKYQHETRAHRQFFAVRLAVASYGGEAIWSFWGMEYIKALLLLYAYTNDDEYLKTADMHIKKYEENMIRDHGFPEVYDKDGKLLETPLYRSVRQTGWVIGFEQARMLRAAVTNKTRK